DPLDVDVGELGDDGDGLGLRWVTGDVLDLADDARADAEGEQGLRRRGGQRHDLPGFRGDRDLGALVIGDGDRKGGGRRGLRGGGRGGRQVRTHRSGAWSPGRRSGTAGTAGGDEEDGDERQ